MKQCTAESCVQNIHGQKIPSHFEIQILDTDGFISILIKVEN